MESFDAPDVGLQNYRTQSEDFNANMFLMWQSNADASFIAVPVGYVNWRINGKAKNLGRAAGWVLTGCGFIVARCPGATTTSWASNDATGPAPGLPTWTTILSNTQPAAGLAVQAEEEQEKDK